MIKLFTSNLLKNLFFFKTPLTKIELEKETNVDEFIEDKTSSIYVIFDNNFKLEFGYSIDNISYFSVEKYSVGKNKKIFFDDANIFSLSRDDIKKLIPIVMINNDEYQLDNLIFYFNDYSELDSIFQKF